jgi:hypothetical protein
MKLIAIVCISAMTFSCNSEQVKIDSTDEMEHSEMEAS